ncbi:transposase, partial [Clostridium botulinum]
MKSKQRNYSKEIKMKAVKMYLEDGMGSTRIA